MKFFIIHKGSDYEQVNEILSEKQQNNKTIKVLMVAKLENDWKKEAKAKIADSNCVIYFLGKETSENIDWELKTADKLNKRIYIVPLKQEYANKYKFEVGEMVDIKNLDFLLMDKDDYLSNILFNKQEVDVNILLEQYKIMIETSENLVERRQKISLSFLTIVSIILPIISTILTFSNMWINLLSVILVILSIILCFCWKSMIISYGELNKAKFDVIEIIENNLPANLFKSEWKASQYNNKKYVSFTKRESIIPTVFMLINIVLGIIGVIIFLFKLL